MLLSTRLMVNCRMAGLQDGRKERVGAIPKFLAAALAVAASAATAADFTARQVTETLYRATEAAPADYSKRDLAGLDLAGLGFKKARLAEASPGASEALIASLGPRIRHSVRISEGRYTLELPLDPSPEHLLAELTAGGAHLSSLNPIRETLEDVFVESVTAPDVLRTNRGLDQAPGGRS